MAFSKDFSAAKPATTVTVAQAIDPSVAAVHPKDDAGFNLAQDTKLSPTPTESIIDEKNPFSDPTIAKYYRELYDNAKYECRDAFDPELEWSAAEEKKLVRKLDYRVCAFACFAFFALQVDRGNLAQAVSDNLLDDLGLTTDDFNTGNTIFKVSFLLAEIPSQLISKKLGPDRWIPMQMIAWSIVAAAQAALSGRASFYACRALIGMLEGGFIPDLILWLSYFYTSKELPIRLSFFWTALDGTQIITAILAFGLLHMRGVHGMAGWRWLFLIEGLITLAVGISAIFLMPSSAVATKTWFRPNGWFTDREVGIVVNRVLRDDPTKGDMHNRKGITPRSLLRSLADYDLLPIYALGLICFIPMGTPNTYLTLSLKQLGFSTFQTNLLVIPSQTMAIFNLLFLTWLSEKFGERLLIGMMQDIWVLPCIIALRTWAGSGVDSWGTYALLTVLLSYPYCHAILVSLASRNSGGVRTRSISAACYNMNVQLGGVIAANVYREDDKPLYHRGNSVLIGINLLAISLFVFAKVYYILRNRSREKVWNAMSAEQKTEYLETTTDEGNKRLEFRFAH
ncbi:hypothetical protein Q7P37_005625 [Cladosporium fusiforme]